MRESFSIRLLNWNSQSNPNRPQQAENFHSFKVLLTAQFIEFIFMQYVSVCLASNTTWVAVEMQI